MGVINQRRVKGREEKGKRVKNKERGKKEGKGETKNEGSIVSSQAVHWKQHDTMSFEGVVVEVESTINDEWIL